MEVEMNRPMAEATSWLSFFEYLKSYIPRWETTTNNTCQTAAVVGIGRRQVSYVGKSSYRPGTPQVDSSYDASSDYGVFMVEKQATELMTVKQYLFDSRPAFLKVKPLSVAKNVYFSRIVRYEGDPATTAFLAAGVIDANDARPQQLQARHFDNLVAQHVIKNAWLPSVIDMFKSLHRGEALPIHVLLDIRTEGIPGVENVAMTNVAAPKTGEGPRLFDFITAPACYNDIQPFIEFLNMLGIHGTPGEIQIDKAKAIYTKIYGQVMPDEFEKKINQYNQILQTMRDEMVRKFRRYAYNIEMNVNADLDPRRQMEAVKTKMIEEAAITIIEGLITIKKDDVRATMLTNLKNNFPNWSTSYPNLFNELLAGTINMYDINWPENFELIDWCLITENVMSKKRKSLEDSNDPKDYMVYVETTIQAGARLPFTALNELVNYMISSQSDPRIQSVRIGVKSKRNKSKRRNTKKKYYFKKKRSSQKK